MTYDIHKLPPNKHQIAAQKSKATEKIEQLPIYGALYWVLLVVIVAVNLGLGLLIDSTTWKFIAIGATTFLWMIGLVFSSSFLDNRRFRYTYELQTHEYIDNGAPVTAIFENWCRHSSQVGRYVAAVSDQGRNLTFGEYLALKEYIKSNRLDSATTLTFVEPTGFTYGPEITTHR